MAAGLHRILLLDDDALVRRAFSRSAAKHHIELTCASTVAEADEALARAPRRFDVVVCDFWLGPRRAATEWIRQLHRARMPVVVLTGDSGAAVDVLGLRVPVFRKPLSLEQLIDEMSSLGAVV